MTLEEVTNTVLEALERQNIPYMIVGALASNLHGVSRATFDADIVIDCDEVSLNRFMDSLQDNFYADKGMAFDALKAKFIFNVIHSKEALKIDLIIKKSLPFDNEQFKRRVLVSFANRMRWVATDEDVILNKLHWCKMSESERRFNDAVNVASVQKKHLDREYLIKWGKELDVQDLLFKLFEHIDAH